MKGVTQISRTKGRRMEALRRRKTQIRTTTYDYPFARFPVFLPRCRAPNKHPVIASLGIHSLPHVLSSPGNERGKSVVIAILHDHCTCEETVNRLIHLGLIRSLLRLISVSDKAWDGVVDSSAALLQHLAVLSESAADAIAAEEGGVWRIVEAVEEGSRVCKESAVGLLLTMCRQDREKYRELILKEGAVPGLLGLGLDGSSKARMMGAQLLRLLRYETDGTVALADGKVEVVRSLMDGIEAGTVALVDEIMERLNA